MDKGQNKLTILKVFYIRRVFRIFPIYYHLIFLLFIINYEQTRTLIWWLTTYTINIYQSISNNDINHLNHLWSLSVEEQFYIFWPFLILFSGKKHRLVILISTIAVSILIKAYLFFYVDKWMATSFFTFSCMYALGLGALIAHISLYRSKTVTLLQKNMWLYIGATAYTLILLFRCNHHFPWFKEIFDEFIFASLSALVILKASTNGFKNLSKNVLEHKVVVYLGKISYGLYLYHLFVPSLYTFLNKYIGVEIAFKPLLFFVYFLITFFLSYLSWQLLEMPLNKYKSKFTYQ